MKDKDLLLLSFLRSNGRESLTNLSKKTKIPVSTIFDRLKYYEQDVISRHTALLDFSKLGYTAKAKILLKVRKEEREDLAKFFQNRKEINSADRINNGYDFIVEGIFKNVKELHLFMEILEEKFDIGEKQIFFVLDELLKENFLCGSPASLPKNYGEDI